MMTMLRRLADVIFRRPPATSAPEASSKSKLDRLESETREALDDAKRALLIRRREDMADSYRRSDQRLHR